MNTELLLKLLRMTTSQHDGEALVAIRKANAMLAAEKKDWEDLLKTGSMIQSSTTFRTPPSQRYVPLADMLKELLENTPTTNGFRSFVESVSEYHTLHGRISPKQYDVIFKAYRKLKQEK